MKHKSPKQLRKKKRNPYNLDDLPHITVRAVNGKKSRADKLPPYDEYNPNKIHVARRRRAWKDHTIFPRGWSVVDEGGNLNIVHTGTTSLLFKENVTRWYINGDNIS